MENRTPSEWHEAQVEALVRLATARSVLASVAVFDDDLDADEARVALRDQGEHWFLLVHRLVIAA
jgi:hypothetical protein